MQPATSNAWLSGIFDGTMAEEGGDEEDEGETTLLG